MCSAPKGTPAAVLNLHIRPNKFGIAEPGSMAYNMALDDARSYFASEEGRKKSIEWFRRAGYASGGGGYGKLTAGTSPD